MKAIEFLREYEIMCNEKADDRLSFVCLLSNEHCNYYYLDISRYFATIMYYVTGNTYYLTCSKKDYIDIGIQCNKIYPITAQLKSFAKNVLTSFANSYGANFLFQDSVDSAIVETKNCITHKKIEHEYFYAGYVMLFNIKVKHVQLYFRNNFSNLLLMIADNQIVTNLKIKLPEPEVLLKLITSKDTADNLPVEVANLIAQIRIVNKEIW